MTEELENLDIKDFTTVSGVADSDRVLLVLSGGTGGKITVGLIRKVIGSDITPSIKDGLWWIGSVSTGVEAEGKSPEFRKGELGLEWKYTTESDSAWRLCVNFADITWKFSDLTVEQRQMLIPHLSDLSADEIAELQQPANEMITVLEKTNTDIEAAEKKRVEAENTRTSQENTRQQQEASRQTNTATAIKNAEAATEAANETATHPTYVGEDNYIYEWDSSTKAYNKTYKLVKAGGLTIDVTYSSVAELQADTKSYNDGLFAMVNTGDVENPEDARLYIRKSGAWEFVVDMSGAIGLTGKTPQLFIGTVSLGGNINSAAVSLSYTGVDDDGNPKYNINYTIPRLTYDDLTDAQIAELQKPASDMIATLKATNDSVTTAENNRVTAENNRVTAENARVKAEQAREQTKTEMMSATTDAKTAANNANNAATSATEAATKASTAANTADTATSNANKATEDAKSATDAAKTATTDANTATTNANNATAAAKTATTNAETATSNANAATTKANTATSNANTAASNANTAATNANSEASRAKTQADNPPKMGDNGNWWKYDETKKEYVDTGILAKGGVLYPTFSVEDDMCLYLEDNDSISASLFSMEDDCLILNVQ